MGDRFDGLVFFTVPTRGSSMILGRVAVNGISTHQSRMIKYSYITNDFPPFRCRLKMPYRLNLWCVMTSLNREDQFQKDESWPKHWLILKLDRDGFSKAVNTKKGFLYLQNLKENFLNFLQDYSLELQGWNWRNGKSIDRTKPMFSANLEERWARFPVFLSKGLEEGSPNAVGCCRYGKGLGN